MLAIRKTCPNKENNMSRGNRGQIPRNRDWKQRVDAIDISFQENSVSNYSKYQEN